MYMHNVHLFPSKSSTTLLGRLNEWRQGSVWYLLAQKRGNIHVCNTTWYCTMCVIFTHLCQKYYLWKPWLESDHWVHSVGEPPIHASLRMIQLRNTKVFRGASLSKVPGYLLLQIPYFSLIMVIPWDIGLIISLTVVALLLTDIFTFTFCELLGTISGKMHWNIITPKETG